MKGRMGASRRLKMQSTSYSVSKACCLSAESSLCQNRRRLRRMYQFVRWSMKPKTRGMTLYSR